MKVEIFHFAPLAVVSCLVAMVTSSGNCPDRQMNTIPESNMFSSLRKPVIIAHRGNPREYQENTIDGILSTVDQKADGYELDIYLTKDEQLVVFHDDNLKAKAGLDKNIWDCTWAEIQRLNLTTSTTRGGKKYTYNKPRKIPKLSDVLEATKQTNLFNLLELKPSEPAMDQASLERQRRTAEKVSDMVVSMGMENKTFLFSFDFFKVMVAKRKQPRVTTGQLFPWKLSKVDNSTVATIKQIVGKEMPQLKDCMELDAPDDGPGFAKFLYRTGVIWKESNASFFDSSINVYNSPTWFTSTIEQLREAYGRKTSTGVYTIYSMGNTEKKNIQSEPKVDLLVKQGIQRLITDDVPRVRKLLGLDTSSQAPSSYAFIGLLVTCSLVITTHLLS